MAVPSTPRRPPRRCGQSCRPYGGASSHGRGSEHGCLLSAAAHDVDGSTATSFHDRHHRGRRRSQQLDDHEGQEAGNPDQGDAGEERPQAVLADVPVAQEHGAEAQRSEQDRRGDDHAEQEVEVHLREAPLAINDGRQHEGHGQGPHVDDQASDREQDHPEDHEDDRDQEDQDQDERLDRVQTARVGDGRGDVGDLVGELAGILAADPGEHAGEGVGELQHHLNEERCRRGEEDREQEVQERSEDLPGFESEEVPDEVVDEHEEAQTHAHDEERRVLVGEPRRVQWRLRRTAHRIAEPVHGRLHGVRQQRGEPTQSRVEDVGHDAATGTVDRAGHKAWDRGYVSGGLAAVLEDLDRGEVARTGNAGKPRYRRRSRSYRPAPRSGSVAASARSAGVTNAEHHPQRHDEPEFSIARTYAESAAWQNPFTLCRSPVRAAGSSLPGQLASRQKPCVSSHCSVASITPLDDLGVPSALVP